MFLYELKRQITQCLYHHFRSVRKIAKSVYTFVIVCRSAWNNSVPTVSILVEFDI